MVWKKRFRSASAGRRLSRDASASLISRHALFEDGLDGVVDGRLGLVPGREGQLRRTWEESVDVRDNSTQDEWSGAYHRIESHGGGRGLPDWGAHSHSLVFTVTSLG